jgi:hypothetical protein
MVGPHRSSDRKVGRRATSSDFSLRDQVDVYADPAPSKGVRPNAPSDPDALPLAERARLLSLARGLLNAVPNPSHARDLALAMVRELEVAHPIADEP